MGGIGTGIQSRANTARLLLSDSPETHRRTRTHEVHIFFHFQEASRSGNCRMSTPCTGFLPGFQAGPLPECLRSLAPVAGNRDSGEQPGASLPL